MRANVGTVEAETESAGALPPWGRADLPPPPAFEFRNVLKTVGPGVIGLGVAIGSGEWLLGPSVIVTYGVGMLWITTVAVLLQVVLNLEMARYTMYTGEPIFTGYMRTWPGPSFWGVLYTIGSFLQYGWPGWALASATATAALVLGRMPTPGDAPLVIWIGFGTFAMCVLLTCAGRKVEQTVERAMWVLVVWIVVYLVAIDIWLVSGDNWAAVATGFVSFGTLPSGADWLLLGAFAAYSGLGGVGNAWVTNWMRDKGYGMGATVGYIPGGRGGDVSPSSSGNVFRVDITSLAAWRAWWKFLNVDQWGIFGCGSLLGMGLTALLTLQFVPAGAQIDGWAVANFQASGIAAAHGRVFWYLTLICGVWILFSTQLGAVDGLPRATTDLLWTASPLVRRRAGSVRRVYFATLVVFAAWGCIALTLTQPLTLIKIGANVGAANFVFLSIHTVVVNRKFLPEALRPPLWREAVVLSCAVFYGAFVLANLVRIFV